ncbi:MAG: glycosyltransferase family 2 protein [Cyanobacteria bacterium J06623_4]
MAELGEALRLVEWTVLLQNPWVLLLGIVLVSIVAMSDFYRRFQRSISLAPRLDALEQLPAQLPAVSVIVPVYNESVNIEACLAAILANEWPSGSRLEVIVSDDESTDDTLQLAKRMAEKDDRVRVISAGRRPTEQVWRGKNWACDRAAEQATGDYLLFIDADVRLAERAIARTVANAQTYKADLLSCAPAIVCGCFAEWVVQPIMANLIAVGFDFEGVNDPERPELALAAGPFMLFRRMAYDNIGGHRAVAADAVEDLALAALIKGKGLKLRYVLGLEVAAVRMYRSLGDLWEGWTKNYHLGSGRNIALTAISAAAVSLIFVMPWVGLVAGLLGSVWQQLLVVGGGSEVDQTVVMWVGLAAAIAVLWQQYLRRAAARTIGQPARYLWLGWLGGLMVSAIAIASIVKTETGWGWTWRGRSLANSGVSGATSAARISGKEYLDGPEKKT